MSLLFSFEEMGNAKDKVIKAIIKAFNQSLNKGTEIIPKMTDVSAIKRTSGISYREVNFTCEDNQTITLMVKNSGDIFRVKLNGRELPIKNQKDHEQAIKEIAVKVIAGSSAFQKRLAAEKKSVTLPKMQSTIKKEEQILATENEQLDQEIAIADKKLEELKAA